jgi:hypothetical protein
VAEYTIEFRSGCSPVAGSFVRVQADEWNLVEDWFHFTDSGKLIKVVMANDVLAITMKPANQPTQ